MTLRFDKGCGTLILMCSQYSVTGSGHVKHQKSSQQWLHTIPEHSAWNNFSFYLLYRALYNWMAADHVHMVCIPHGLKCSNNYEKSSEPLNHSANLSFKAQVNVWASTIHDQYQCHYWECREETRSFRHIYLHRAVHSPDNGLPSQNKSAWNDLSHQSTRYIFILGVNWEKTFLE